MLFLKYKEVYMARKIHVLHIKEINHFNKAGELLWKDEDLDNVLHDEGELYILSAAFATGYSGYGVAPDNLYLGLDTSTRTLGETDTLSLVGENSQANGYERKALSTHGTGVSGQDFVLNQPTTFYRAESKIWTWSCVNDAWTTVTKLFLCTAPSGISGKLICSVPLSSSRLLQPGDVISAAIYIGLSE
jgi:hypothetical protein